MFCVCVSKQQLVKNNFTIENIIFNIFFITFHFHYHFHFSLFRFHKKTKKKKFAY